jgi:hypothetical protein
MLDMIPEEEQAKRRYNVEQAFHSSRMEGLEPSQESVELSEKWIRDEITLDEWHQKIMERYQK